MGFGFGCYSKTNLKYRKLSYQYIGATFSFISGPIQNILNLKKKAAVLERLPFLGYRA